MNLANSLVLGSFWYPTVLGVLVVISAVVLFIGSVYLLLGTNLGARLGFLITFTCLMGFLIVLSALWLTTASPLESPKGRVSSWKVVDSVSNVDKSKIDAVHGAVKKSNKASATDASNVASAVDAALITKKSTPTVTVTPNDNKYAKFEDVTKFMILETYSVGGSEPHFYKGEFNHAQKYAIIEYCAVKDQTQTFGLPPLPPECADSQRGFVVAQFDYGTLRLPPFVVLVIVSVLFGVGLLALHWREKDEMAAEEEKNRPAAAKKPDDSELAKV